MRPPVPPRPVIPPRVKALKCVKAATGARAAAGRAGIDVDGQRFRPHLTVARMGRPTGVTEWIEVLDAYAGPACATIAELRLGEALVRARRQRVDCAG